MEKQSELENDTLAIVKKLREEQAQSAAVISALNKTIIALQERLAAVDGKVPDVGDFDFVFDD